MPIGIGGDSVIANSAVSRHRTRVMPVVAPPDVVVVMRTTVAPCDTTTTTAVLQRRRPHTYRSHVIVNYLCRSGCDTVAFQPSSSPPL